MSRKRASGSIRSDQEEGFGAQAITQTMKKPSVRGLKSNVDTLSPWSMNEFEVFYDGDCPLCMREIAIGPFADNVA